MTRVEDKHIDIESIVVNGRHRSDLGDLTSLKDSIERLGVLHPVVVTSSRRLIAGHRRLEAIRELGWASAPVRFMDELGGAQELLEAERDENTCRLDMKPSEKVALGIALEALERPAAEKRRAHGLTAPGRTLDINDPKRSPRTADIVGAAVGMAAATYNRAKTVVRAAEAGDPVAVEALVEMDRTGRVSTAYAKVAERGTNDARRKPEEPLPVKTDRQRRVAEAKARRLANGIYGLEGTCAGLMEVDLRYVLPVTTDEDLTEWDRLLGEATRAISRFRRELNRERSTTA